MRIRFFRKWAYYCRLLGVGVGQRCYGRLAAAWARAMARFSHAVESKPKLEIDIDITRRARALTALSGLNIAAMTLRTRPNRRGRGLRGPLLPQQTPRYRSQRERFDMAVLEAYAPIQNAFADQLTGLDLAVDTVPRMRLRPDMTVMPDEIIADGPVPLGRIVPAGIDSSGRPTRARLVIFRMPITQRAATARERYDLLRTVIAALVANYLNLEPEDVDPRFS